jgi:accessory gene regulator B
MIDKITQFLTNKIRNEMPEVDDEKAEIIDYGLKLIIGEIPKTFIMLLIAYALGVFKLSLITFLILLPYRGASGGFHLRTHIGCIISTCTFYCGIAMMSRFIVLASFERYLIILAVAVFGAIIIKLYAPADTEWVPIISKKVRKKKQILSYVFFFGGLLVATFLPNPTITNIIIFGYLVQTCMITRLAYKLTNNKYGHELYQEASN